jgi:hypothetical protein
MKGKVIKTFQKRKGQGRGATTVIRYKDEKGRFIKKEKFAKLNNVPVSFVEGGISFFKKSDKEELPELFESFLNDYKKYEKGTFIKISFEEIENSLSGSQNRLNGKFISVSNLVSYLALWLSSLGRPVYKSYFVFFVRGKTNSIEISKINSDEFEELETEANPLVTEEGHEVYFESAPAKGKRKKRSN